MLTSLSNTVTTQEMAKTCESIRRVFCIPEDSSCSRNISAQLSFVENTTSPYSICCNNVAFLLISILRLILLWICLCPRKFLNFLASAKKNP